MLAKIMRGCMGLYQEQGTRTVRPLDEVRHLPEREQLTIERYIMTGREPGHE